jgi:O-antigen ligase
MHAHYNVSISELVHTAYNRPAWRRALDGMRRHATMPNLIGLAAALCALFCLIALPEPWDIRLPLYLAVTIWTIIRPRVALYLLPIAVPWGSLDALTIGGANLNSADILVFLLAAAWLMSFALRPYLTPYMARAGTMNGPLDREGFNVPRFLAFALLALLFAMLLSMTVTLSINLSLKEIIKWIEVLIVLFIGAQYIRTRRQIWTLVVIICLAAVSQAIMGYVQNFYGLGPTAFIRNSALRVYGTFGQPNPYAGYINMTLTVTIALMLLARSWSIRILAGFTTILLAAAVYFSQSRGGDIALAVAVLFIVTLGMPRIRPLMSAAGIGALVIVAGYLAGVVPEHYLDPILKVLGLTSISFTAPSAADYSTAERIAHWIAGARMFMDHPFLGVGIGNYPEAYPRYFITIFVNPLGHAHNYYINIAAEAGIFGLLGLLLFLVASFVAGARSFRAISRKWRRVKTGRERPEPGTLAVEAGRTAGLLRRLTNDRALAVGLLASLLAVCAHNMVDDLYVHSMTSLMALLLVLLIRLPAVAPGIDSDGGRFAERRS